MRTVKQQYHGGIKVEADVYKVDIELADRYVSFSGEILRLASLGLAGYGFLLADLVLKPTPAQAPGQFTALLSQNTGVLALGAVMLAGAAASAIAHRYYSVECLTHFIRILRLKSPDAADRLHATAASLDQSIESENRSLSRDLVNGKRALGLAVGALVAAVACAAWALAATLWRLS